MLQEIAAVDRRAAFGVLGRHAALIAKLPEDERERLIEKIQDAIADK
jgi:hypothetical protein